MRKNLLFILAALIAWKLFTQPGSVSYGPGVTAAEPPLQTSSSYDPFRYLGHNITPVADFTLKAKVLSRKDYSRGREAKFSPTDLALGWGNMSDESVIDKISISQRNRFYYWRVTEFPIPRKQIETQSANMHLVPANQWVAEELQNVRVGDLIQLSGSLINISADDGWRWRSSKTRNDIGAGACELIWVDSLTIQQL